MLLKLEEPEILLNGIEIISGIVTEVRIKVNEEGLSITAIDPANVSMLYFKISKNSFSEFEGDKEIIGVNLEDLKRILKRASNSSSIILKTKDNTLEIEIQDKIKRIFTLELIKIDSEEIDFYEKISRMEFVAEVNLNSKDLSYSIEDCLVVADACSFIIKDKKFIIEAKNLNSARSEFSLDEVEIKGEECKARYSLEYLNKFIKGIKISDKVSLSFSDEHPLKVEFKNPKVSLKFILAPRVEVED